jgi:hypothetical protein
MNYARDRRTKRIVQADKVRWTERNRVYECPVCKAAVHFRTAMGLSPYPGFAHNAHAGRLDCDLYHPSFGGEVSTVRVGKLEDDGTSEFDLCLDDQENWSLFLRFSEISDIGNIRLRTLADASVNVWKRLEKHLPHGTTSRRWECPSCHPAQHQFLRRNCFREMARRPSIGSMERKLCRDESARHTLRVPKWRVGASQVWRGTQTGK